MDDSRPADLVEPDLRKPAAERVAIWEDFVDIFHDPSAVFARREHGSVLIPLMIITVVIGLLYFVNRGVLDPIIAAELSKSHRVIESKARLSAEDRAAMQSFAGISAAITAFVSTPFVILFGGLLVWVVGRMVGASQTMHAAMIVAAYANIPRILAAVVVGVHGLFMEPAQLTGVYKVTLSAARFLDPTTAFPLALALLGRIDLFSIWVAMLLAIGLGVTGRLSRERVILAGFLIWLIPTVVALFSPLLRGAAK